MRPTERSAGSPAAHLNERSTARLSTRHASRRQIVGDLLGSQLEGCLGAFALHTQRAIAPLAKVHGLEQGGAGLVPGTCARRPRTPARGPRSDAPRLCGRGLHRGEGAARAPRGAGWEPARRASRWVDPPATSAAPGRPATASRPRAARRSSALRSGCQPGASRVGAARFKSGSEPAETAVGIHQQAMANETMESDTRSEPYSRFDLASLPA